ncbi:MAG: glycosyltransferase [Actinomycetota bacterium]|nr:glycosyltransferase [Actinomycetota bacterium]MDD5667754.1 glycosyltransferase [Actinomycetota bacterium]
MAEYRMLVVNHAVETGGAERVLIRLLESLDRGLFEPALACPREGPLTVEAEKLGIEAHLGYPSPRLLEVKRRSVGNSGAGVLLYPYDLARTVRGLARLIRRGGFDLVYTNSAKADIYGSLAGWVAGRPVVWRLHDIVTAEAFSRFNMFLFKSCASLFASRVLAVSGAASEALVALGVPRRKVRTLYNGIDLASVKPERGRESVRVEWDIEANAPLVGMVGRLVDWKGPDVFLRAAAAIARELSGARFMLVGDATFGEKSYVDELKGMCADLGLEEKVVFTGFRSDVAEIMASLDLLVHASVLPDPLPTVLIEAMALGIPVIAAAGGGVGEIVEDGVTGLVVPPGDAEGMAVAALRVLGRRDEAVRMGEAGKKRAAEVFDIGLRTREMERELCEVIAGAGGRGRRLR